MRARMALNRSRETTTSDIWNVRYPACRTTLGQTERRQDCPVKKLDETKDQDGVGHGHESQFASDCVGGVRREGGHLALHVGLGDPLELAHVSVDRLAAARSR